MDFERADESCEASWLAEAVPRLAVMPIMSLDNDFDGYRDAVTGVALCL